MRKIKICHITEATSGGVWTHIKQLAQHVDRDKFEQHFILSSKKNKELIYLDFLYGHPVHVIDMERNIKLGYDFLAVVRIINVLRKNQFDIVHCHSSKAGAVGRLAAIFAKIHNVIYTPHAFSFFNTHSKSRIFFMVIEKVLLRWTYKVICVSEDELELSLLSGFPRMKMSVIRNGVEIPSLHVNQVDGNSYSKVRDFTANSFVIGFVGRMEEQKDPLTLLHALSRLPSNVKGCYVGDGNMMSIVKKQASTLGVQNRVLFMGEQDNVFPLLTFFNLFVSASRWEGLPYTVLEAIASSVPVVLTDVPGHRELVRHREDGLLYRVGDAEELASQITYAFRHQEHIKEMAEKAMNKVKTKYTVSIMIKSYESLYQGIQVNLK